LLKQTKTAYTKISEKEVEIEDIANEISRVKIDVLNTSSQNELLKNKLNDLISELKEKEKEVDRFEQQIKEKHLEIQKKQHKVDRLNRQLGELTKNGSDENVGPLEATKNNLQKQIKERDEMI
jgi:chromosome segregation ATPase